MNQRIRNALDDLETASERVESDFEADMINESVETIREELDGVDELVDSFRRSGERADSNENYGYAFGREDCADELERVLDE